MMRFQIRINAGPDTRFTAAAAASLVGQRPALNTRGTDDGPVTADLGRGRVVAAEVVADGAAMLVTVESEGEPVPLDQLMAGRPPMSFRVPPESEE